MNQQERELVTRLRAETKKRGMNRYRFAWFLLEKYPNVVIEIIRKYIADEEKEQTR